MNVALFTHAKYHKNGRTDQRMGPFNGDQTKRPETKHPWTKHPWGQNVHSDKTSVGTKRPSDKTSVGQNILQTKRPWGQNVSGQNVCLGHNYQGLVRQNFSLIKLY
jgi:hypothetical protein